MSELRINNDTPWKHLYGLGVPCPEPQLDWNTLRQDKLRCTTECAVFSELNGGCSLGLMPSAKCRSFKHKPKEVQQVRHNRDLWGLE